MESHEDNVLVYTAALLLVSIPQYASSLRFKRQRIDMTIRYLPAYRTGSIRNIHTNELKTIQHLSCIIVCDNFEVLFGFMCNNIENALFVKAQVFMKRFGVNATVQQLFEKLDQCDDG